MYSVGGDEKMKVLPTQHLHDSFFSNTSMVLNFNTEPQQRLRKPTFLQKLNGKKTVWNQATFSSLLKQFALQYLYLCL